MSADSPRRGLHKGAQVISPQPISDKSIIDSVAGIINDIVPQAYTSTPSNDNKEAITWARFEFADITNNDFFPDFIERSSSPPLLLVLGYATGVQVWLVAASGEATEVLSWRQGVVRTLRILPNPNIDNDDQQQQQQDLYKDKRPLVAICDSSGTGTQFCNISFVSLRTGEQVKNIKFKNPVCDVLANKKTIVVTFAEKIAVFDSRKFDDILTVTTCYQSPGPNQNPVALGTRWLAYSEKKLIPSRRSSGGSEGEGVQSYTATVLYAAKSLGKGLRGLGETVASSLTGTTTINQLNVNNINNDITQPGVVTIIDLQAAKNEKDNNNDDITIETIIAHFTAHSDAIVSMIFDLTGAILMTADRRGHDFHVFRIQPHPGGPTLAAVHHLYVLHRGDTTAKVQDMSFSSDTRWAVISTVRGTTHVFPVAPYGGQIGMRTHSTSHVVNRLSRFHKSAGLTDDNNTRSHSPVSHNNDNIPISVYPYTNPRLPPYPHPTIIHPLAQIRQPSKLNTTNYQIQTNRTQQRQRLHSDDNGSLPLKICACFAPSRTWIYTQRDSSTSKINNKRAIDSLFIMACHGNMIQYDLEPKPATGVPKEKICDDTMIELEVEAKGQWPLLRVPNSLEIIPPLSPSSPLLNYFGTKKYQVSKKDEQQMDTAEDRWLSQVEIVTHAGPHRRLWMGPQFVFKTYNAPSGVNLVESEAVEIGVTGGSRPARSNPVNMPHAASRPLVPVIIDGSGSSYEQSPRFMEVYGDSLENDSMGSGHGENQLREDLAEAMLETSTVPNRVPGRRLVVERVGQPVTKVVNPLGTVITVLADEEDANTNQEYDDIDETHAELPRSLCAEEGPASLSDIEQDGCPLRNLTEICAEMRTGNETTIDTISDDNISEIKENKSLCVTINNSLKQHNTIDYEKTDSFHDITRNLSLCVEKGEIPNSTMFKTHDNNYWCKKTNKIINDKIQKNHNITNAKYVVNYDEHSVVLMENKTTDNKNILINNNKNDIEIERAIKRPNKQFETITQRGTKRITASSREQQKYHLHENDDSIIIEVTNPPIIDIVSNETSDNNDNKERRSSRVKNNNRKLKNVNNNNNNNNNNSNNNIVGEAMIVDSKLLTNTIEPIESFVDLKTIDYYPDIDLQEPMEATVANCCNLTAQLPTIDDFNCMDYHIIEPNVINTKDNTYTNKSDDDIEHIFNTDDIIDDKIINIDEDYDLPSPIFHRKCSKSTISDDDLEHIQTSEISELFERAKSFVVDKNNDDLICQQDDYPKQLSDDDEIEHIVNEDIDEPILLSSSSSSSSPPQLQPATSSLPPINEIIKSQNTKLLTNKTDKKQSTRNSRKRKDNVVVIENEKLNKDINVKSIVSIDDIKTNTPINDTIDNNELIIDNKDEINEQLNLQCLPKKTKVRTSKTNIQKAMSNCIEIIDIDAMEKAEMKVNNIVNIPECKILEQCPDISLTRHKKSRKNKKIHANNDHLISTTTKQCEQLTDNNDDKNWDEIVYRPNLTEVVQENVTIDKTIDEIKLINNSDEDKQIKKYGKKSIELNTDDNNTSLELSKNNEKISSKNDMTMELKSPLVEEITSKNSEKIDQVVDESKTNEVNEEIIVENIDQVLDDKDVLKEVDKNQEIIEEEQVTLEDSHPRVVPMDTEDDTNNVKDIAEKTNTSNVPPPTWPSVAKKNNRSKKKKRR